MTPEASLYYGLVLAAVNLLFLALALLSWIFSRNERTRSKWEMNH